MLPKPNQMRCLTIQWPAHTRGTHTLVNSSCSRSAPGSNARACSSSSACDSSAFRFWFRVLQYQY